MHMCLHFFDKGKLAECVIVAYRYLNKLSNYGMRLSPQQNAIACFWTLDLCEREKVELMVTVFYSSYKYLVSDGSRSEFYF